MNRDFSGVAAAGRLFSWFFTSEPKGIWSIDPKYFLLFRRNSIERFTFSRLLLRPRRWPSLTSCLKRTKSTFSSRWFCTENYLPCPSTRRKSSIASSNLSGGHFSTARPWPCLVKATLASPLEIPFKILLSSIERPQMNSPPDRPSRISSHPLPSAQNE